MEDLLLPLLLYRRGGNANDDILRHLPDNGSSTMVIVGVVMVVVASAIVAARLTSQYALRRKLYIEDWMILASVVMSLSQTALQCVQVRYGWGKHAHDLPPDYLKMTLKMFYLSQNGYKLSISLTKISILLLYLRIFPLVTFMYVANIMIFTIAAFGIGTTFSTVFQCTPIPRAWDHTIPGHCINKSAFWLADNIFFIMTDIMLLILPMPVIHSLRLPWRTKVGLVMVFGLGGCACVTSVLRLTTLKEAAAAQDPTWNIITTFYWSCVETNLGIICACLPVLKAPLALLFPRLFSSRHSSPGGSDEENTPRRKRPSVFRDPFPTSTIRGEELGIVTLNPKTDGFRGDNIGTVSSANQWSVVRRDGTGLGFAAKGAYEKGHERRGSEEAILREGEIKKTVGVSVHVVGGAVDPGDTVGTAR